MNAAMRIKMKANEFGDWLSSVGAQVLEPTNAYEVMRFKAGDITSVIYRNKVGGVTHSGVSKEAWEAFNTGKSWRAAPATRRKRMTPNIRTLRARDGDLCFFCQKVVGQDNESVEHLVSITHGGTNHISNLLLAHKTCNAKAGNLSAMEKIKIHTHAVITGSGILEYMKSVATHHEPIKADEQDFLG